MLLNRILHITHKSYRKQYNILLNEIIYTVTEDSPDSVKKAVLICFCVEIRKVCSQPPIPGPTPPQNKIQMIYICGMSFEKVGWGGGVGVCVADRRREGGTPVLQLNK